MWACGRGWVRGRGTAAAAGTSNRTSPGRSCSAGRWPVRAARTAAALCMGVGGTCGQPGRARCVLAQLPSHCGGARRVAGCPRGAAQPCFLDTQQQRTVCVALERGGGGFRHACRRGAMLACHVTTRSPDADGRCMGHVRRAPPGGHALHGRGSSGAAVPDTAPPCGTTWCPLTVADGHLLHVKLRAHLRLRSAQPLGGVAGNGNPKSNAWRGSAWRRQASRQRCTGQPCHS